MEGSSDEIRSVPRDPLRFELLPLFAAHIEARGATLQDVGACGVPKTVSCALTCGVWSARASSCVLVSVWLASAGGRGVR